MKFFKQKLLLRVSIWDPDKIQMLAKFECRQDLNTGQYYSQIY